MHSLCISAISGDHAAQSHPNHNACSARERPQAHGGLDYAVAEEAEQPPGFFGLRAGESPEAESARLRADAAAHRARRQASHAGHRAEKRCRAQRLPARVKSRTSSSG